MMPSNTPTPLNPVKPTAAAPIQQQQPTPPPAGKPAVSVVDKKMKRQRSYERGASEGALNLPANRGRRASCDFRAAEAAAAALLSKNKPTSNNPEKQRRPSGVAQKAQQQITYEVNSVLACRAL